MNKLVEELRELEDESNDYFEFVASKYGERSKYDEGLLDAYGDAAERAEKYINGIMAEIENLSARHSYKVVGHPDTYSQYAEG